MVIELTPAAGRLVRVDGDDLTFPLWREDVPVRFELARINLGPVIKNPASRGTTDVDKQVFVFWILKVMLALPPFTLVFDLRQQQGRLKRFQSFHLLVKKLVRRSHTADTNISEVLAGADLSGDARDKARATPADAGELDLRVFFLEQLNDFI